MEYILLQKYFVYKNTSCLSIFSPNAGEYGPEKTPYLDTFHAVLSIVETIIKKSPL